MLNYRIKLTDGDIKAEELVWREKYLSSDLSFITGVTSQDYHLEKFNKLAVSNTSLSTPNNILQLESKNVKRQGYAVIIDKEYAVNSGTVIDYSTEDSGTTIEYKYIFLNGKYYYSDSADTFQIDNWLVESGNIVVETSISVSGTSAVTIDTIAWIEDGKVVIDGNEYIYDFEREGLKYFDDGRILFPSEITACEDIEFKPYVDYVTKFKLLKGEDIEEPFEAISFVKYYYFIKYKDEYLNIYKVGDYFYYDIPKYLMDGSEDLSPISGRVFYANDTNVDALTEDIEISGRTFDALRENTCYVRIEGTTFFVENEVLNANEGKEIAIYLEDGENTINIGDRLCLVRTFEERYPEEMHTINEEFVIYGETKYKVEPNICDRAIINGSEFDIDYINGKTESADCLVMIDGEAVPMEIIKEEENFKLKRYGKVMTPIEESIGLSPTTNPYVARDARYDILQYSGVTINGNKYRIENESGETKYIMMDLPKEYTFVVSNIIGSSMLICSPYLSLFDYNEEFIDEMSRYMCDDVVTNQVHFSVYGKNNVFGNREITKELAFNVTNTPISSDDYFNLFDNFTIYTNNGYIHIPLSLNAPQGGNPLLDDTVQRDFFEAKKKEAINPIIDMEKDVYIPKSFEGGYNGSSTDFKEIEEIRINLHFRTRNLENWKIIEDGNWFITDYFPYEFENHSDISKSILNKVWNHSDLVGLLNFTNNDVYYQKSKIAKSFLRLSFYDSTDKQNQTLLATSTVFMDEHRMFKRYVDNSRKNENNFIAVNSNDEVKFRNKISVNSELYNGEIDDETEYNYEDLVIDDDHRIGSEFIIKNKYETDTSSEGYYLYIFREYSENLSPKPIYMKVEFNHAGIGHIIPFTIPMLWSENADSNGYIYPESALTPADLDVLKNGTNLEDANEQMYIPLYAVYDFKHKEYGYVFDSRYVTVEDGNITMNLFEMKFNEGKIPADIDLSTRTNILKGVTYGTQPTAKINVNTSQFPSHDKKCGE